MDENTEIKPQSQPHQGKLLDTLSIVDVKEATGTFFLGILAIILIILLERSYKRYQALLETSVAGGH